MITRTLHKKEVNPKTEKKVLVVDDEQDFLDTTGTWLKNNGYIVFTALNGEEAIKVIKAEGPNLIIADMGMPVMNGYTLYQHVKGMSECSNVPVIVTSARIEMRDVLEAEGVAAFLSKPFSLKELSLKVNSLLG